MTLELLIAKYGLLAVFLGVERIFSPNDFRFVKSLLAGAARSGGPGALTLEERE